MAHRTAHKPVCRSLTEPRLEILRAKKLSNDDINSTMDHVGIVLTKFETWIYGKKQIQTVSLHLIEEIF